MARPRALGAVAAPRAMVTKTPDRVGGRAMTATRAIARGELAFVDVDFLDFVRTRGRGSTARACARCGRDDDERSIVETLLAISREGRCGGDVGGAWVTCARCERGERDGDRFGTRRVVTGDANAREDERAIEELAKRMMMRDLARGKGVLGGAGGEARGYVEALWRRVEAFGTKHHDARLLDDGFRGRASENAKDVRERFEREFGAKLTDACDVSEDAFLEALSKVALNALEVKIPSRLTRFFAEMDDDERYASPSARREIVDILREIVRVRGKEVDGSDEDGSADSDDDSQEDDDSSSDDDSEQEEEEEEDDSEEADEVMEFSIDGVSFTSELFPPTEGVVLLGSASNVNHSCEPSCEVAFIHDARAHVIATRDIAKGEEITISYVPGSWPLRRRRKELLDRYGFACDCALCERQLALASNRRVRQRTTSRCDTQLSHQ